MQNAPAAALSLRDAARRSRAAGKLHDAYASLETADHVSPGDVDVLRELVELATELDDHEGAARHLAALAARQSGARKGEALLALADVYYDKLDDLQRARTAMREAAEAFGSGTRRDATLRMLASEAASHLAWEIAVDAVQQIDVGRRSGADHVLLATALVRAGRPNEAVRVIEDATASGKFDDGGLLLESLEDEVQRRARYNETAQTMEQDAVDPKGDTLESPSFAGSRSGAEGRRGDEIEMWHSIGSAVGVPAIAARSAAEGAALRDRLLHDQANAPEDPETLQKLLAYLEPREPELRRQVLERVAAEGGGRAQAIACHELALIARNINHDPLRAAALWQKAHRVDPSYTPVWMPLADALVAGDEVDLARDLYEQVAASPKFDDAQRSWAADRADALGHDDSVVSGEIGVRITDRDIPVTVPDVEVEEEIDLSLARAREHAEYGEVEKAIKIAEQAVDRNASDVDALELLEVLYFHAGDVTAASEAIGRQLTLTDDPDLRANLWRRRAKLYRDALGRDSEAYRCLKEAHACAPADPEIAYQLRTAAMVRGEWALVASLLYREIAAAASPRDRGALHLELALIYQEKLDDADQAQVNFEQALAFDPSIPAVRAPLAQRYEAIGRHADAARLFGEAAATARAADRPALINAAGRNRALANAQGPHAQLVGQLDRAVMAGDIDGAVDVAHQLWKADPGNGTAYRVLAGSYRMSGDLAGLTDLTTVRVTHATNADDRASAWLDVARLADDLGKRDDAVRAYDLALTEDPHSTAALDARATLAFKLADWTTAERLYRELPVEDSVLGADDLTLRRSVIAEQLGRHEEALALAKLAAQYAPGRSDVMMRVQHLATAVGELRTAIGAARTVLDLIPLTDEDAALRTRHSLVELYRMVGEFDNAIGQLEYIVKDHPHHSPSIELIAEMYIAKNDWPTATRYLYQLVPLAPTPTERAERLYRLGDAILVHLNDIDRADDVFLRASDLDPQHVPTLRRLLDVYWRADDPGALVEVAGQLAAAGPLAPGPIAKSSLAQALVAAALCGEIDLARQLVSALGETTAETVAAALADLTERTGKLELKGAATAVVELARREVLDLHQLRAAASDQVRLMLATD
jgi:tetratricopeptide (TPR) repeat protein